MNNDVDKRKDDLFGEIESEMSTPGIIDFKHKVSKIDAQLHNAIPIEKSTSKSFLAKSILIISVLLLVLFLIFQNYNKFNISPASQKFALNDEPYKMILNSRSDQEKTVVLKSAISSYMNEEYEKAGNQFDQLINEFPDELIYTFYAGNAAYAIGNYKEAINYFNKVINENNSLLIEQSIWYKALSYYKNKEYKQARKQLKTIEKSHYKYDDAQKILNLIPD